jgi:hypothetical protein
MFAARENLSWESVSLIAAAGSVALTSFTSVIFCSEIELVLAE